MIESQTRSPRGDLATRLKVLEAELAWTKGELQNLEKLVKRHDAAIRKQLKALETGAAGPVLSKKAGV